MKIIKIAFLSICIAGLTGCHEGFNDLPVDFSEIEVVVTDSVSVLQYVAAIYKELPNGFNRIENTAMIGCATDEAVHSAPGGTYIDRMGKCLPWNTKNK